MQHIDTSRNRLIKRYRKTQKKLLGLNGGKGGKYLSRLAKLEEQLHLKPTSNWRIFATAICISVMIAKPDALSAQIFAPVQTNPFSLTQLDPTYAWDERLDIADLDGDGDKDLFVGQGWVGLLYFENIGNDGTPEFVPAGVDPFGITTLSPNFVDIDADGDLDVFHGESDAIPFQENIGTATSPVFAEAISPAFNINPLPVCGGSNPAFADFDFDGDYDIITGIRYWAYCGEGFSSYYLFYFENSGTASLPNYEPWIGWQVYEGEADPFALGYHWPPYATSDINGGDIDNDGDIDVFRTVTYGGAPKFVLNNGSPEDWNYEETAYPPDFVNPYHTTNCIADIDNDGDQDIMTISGYYYDRNFYYYENTLCNLDVPTELTATIITPTSAILNWSPADDGYDFVVKIRDLTTGGIRKKYVSDPTYTFTSLTPGHDYAFTVWTECADFDTRRGPSEAYYFSTPMRAGILDAQALIYPNPAHDQITIDLQVFDGSPVLIRVYNTIGESMTSILTEEQLTQYMLSLPYPSGTYYVQLIAGEKTAVAAIIKN